MSLFLEFLYTWSRGRLVRANISMELDQLFIERAQVGWLEAGGLQALSRCSPVSHFEWRRMVVVVTDVLKKKMGINKKMRGINEK